MNLMRIYHVPKGYTDVVCDHVTLDDVVWGKSCRATVHGGLRDGMVYHDCRGVKLIGENVPPETPSEYRQGSLFE